MAAAAYLHTLGNMFVSDVQQQFVELETLGDKT